MNNGKYHLGERIEEVLKNHGMSKAEFARRIYTSRQNVNALLHREDISVWQLAQIGKVLQHNFLAEVARNLQAQLSPSTSPQTGANTTGQRELIVLFHQAVNSRVFNAIQCLETHFGPESEACRSGQSPLIFQGIYHLMQAPKSPL